MSNKAVAARYRLAYADVSARRYRNPGPPLSFLRAARLLFVERRRQGTLSAAFSAYLQGIRRQMLDIR